MGSPTLGLGDLDVVIYSARKWARLALSGNPSVLLLLFVPDDDWLHRSYLSFWPTFGR